MSLFLLNEIHCKLHESCYTTKKKKKNAQMHVTVASKHIDMLQEKSGVMEISTLKIYIFVIYDKINLKSFS